MISPAELTYSRLPRTLSRCFVSRGRHCLEFTRYREKQPVCCLCSLKKKDCDSWNRALRIVSCGPHTSAATSTIATGIQKSPSEPIARIAPPRSIFYVTVYRRQAMDSSVAFFSKLICAMETVTFEPLPNLPLPLLPCQPERYCHVRLIFPYSCPRARLQAVPIALESDLARFTDAPVSSLALQVCWFHSTARIGQSLSTIFVVPFDPASAPSSTPRCRKSLSRMAQFWALSAIM
jgi:hypothetical protein